MKLLLIGLLSIFLVSGFPPRNPQDMLLAIRPIVCDGLTPGIIVEYHGQGDKINRVEFSLIDGTVFAVTLPIEPDRNDIVVFVLNPVDGTITKYNNALEANANGEPCDIAAKFISGKLL